MFKEELIMIYDKDGRLQELEFKISEALSLIKQRKIEDAQEVLQKEHDKIEREYK
jgi:hypothetical protein